tara:strand:- start:620 stop:2008 length:1389 start_codon:yes stop_codon:yes gene_type:complete
MKNLRNISSVIILFISFFFSEITHSTEQNIKKCIEFSSIGLHEPAIEQCQKAISDGVNNKEELELLYYLANSYSSINSNKMASQVMQKLIKANPNARLEDYYLAGIIEIKLNNHNGAINYFEMAIKEGLNSVDINRQLARALFKSGDEKRANLILTGVIFEDNSDIQSMIQLSENYIVGGNLTKANNIIDNVININSDYSYAYYLKYIISITEDNLGDALVHINKAIMRDRKSTKYLFEKVKLLTANKKYDLAKYNLAQIESINPNEPGVPSLLNEILDLQSSDLHSNARVMVKLKNYKDAINYYNKAIKLNPSDEILYFERGQSLLILENYAEAKNDLLIASSMNQKLNENNLNLMLGKIYYKLNERNESIIYMNNELEINSNNQEALLWQIRSYSEAGQYDVAENYAQKFIENNPDSPTGYSILGDIKLMQGDIQKSNELHNRVIELDPNHNIATKKNLE